MDWSVLGYSNEVIEKVLRDKEYIDLNSNTKKAFELKVEPGMYQKLANV
jgi:hypothetical protein